MIKIHKIIPLLCKNNKPGIFNSIFLLLIFFCFYLTVKCVSKLCGLSSCHIYVICKIDKTIGHSDKNKHMNIF